MGRGKTDYWSILLIKPGAMGDLLQVTPVLRALREKFPPDMPVIEGALMVTLPPLPEPIPST